MTIAVEVGFSFTLSPGSSRTLPLAITNQNNDDSVAWSAAIDAGPKNWLQLDRYAGILNPMEVQTLYVTANASGMHFGDYQAKLTFSSTSGNINLPGVELWVELHVVFDVFSDNGPHIVVSSNPDAHIRAARIGENTMSWRVTNPQVNGQVKWTMGTGGVDWVDLNPDSGTLQAGEQVKVFASYKSGLKAGNYRTDLILTFTFDTEADATKKDREPTSILIPVTLKVPSKGQEKESAD